MSLSSATLATQLQNMDAVDNEATAITTLVTAYGVFASDATSNGVSISSAAVTAAKAIMATALAGMSESSAGLTKIPAAVVAFWGSVAAGLAASFTGATAIVAPPHATLVDEFADLMEFNTDNSVSKQDSLTALADLLAEQALGGSATFPGPTVAPII